MTILIIENVLGVGYLHTVIIHMNKWEMVNYNVMNPLFMWNACQKWLINNAWWLHQIYIDYTACRMMGLHVKENILKWKLRNLSIPKDRLNDRLRFLFIIKTNAMLFSKYILLNGLFITCITLLTVIIHLFIIYCITFNKDFIYNVISYIYK